MAAVNVRAAMGLCSAVRGGLLAGGADPAATEGRPGRHPELGEVRSKRGAHDGGWYRRGRSKGRASLVDRGNGYPHLPSLRVLEAEVAKTVTGPCEDHQEVRAA
jgi:hypothetical protein